MKKLDPTDSLTCSADLVADNLYRLGEVVYARTTEAFDRNLLFRTEDQLANYKNRDDDPRGPWTRGSLIRREGDYFYPVKRPDGVDIYPPKGSSCLDARIEASDVEVLGQGIIEWHKALAPVGDTTACSATAPSPTP